MKGAYMPSFTADVAFASGERRVYNGAVTIGHQKTIQFYTGQIKGESASGIVVNADQKYSTRFDDY
jgi:hypothetical protein